MTKKSPTPAGPTLCLLGCSKPLELAINQVLDEQHLPLPLKSVASPQTASNNDLLFWHLTEPHSQAGECINYLKKADIPSKVLILISADQTHQDARQVKERIEEIDGYIKEIINISQAKQSDIRVIVHTSLYDSHQAEEGSLSLLASLLQRGTNPNLGQASIYPVTYVSLVKLIIKTWFDRGHRNQSILIKGSQIDQAEWGRLITNTTTELPQKPLEAHWADCTEIGFDDALTTKTDMASLKSYLSANISVAAVTPPPPPPAKKSVPHTNQPANKKPEEEISIPSFIARDNLAAAMPKEVTKPKESAPPPPPPPPKTLKKQPKSISSLLFKYVSITLVAIAIAYIAVAYGTIALALVQAGRFSPENNDQLSASQQKLQTATNQYQTLTDWSVNLKPFTALDAMITTKIQSASEQLLRKQLDFHLSTGFATFFSQQEGSSHTEFAKAKLILDQLYLLASKQSYNPDQIAKLESARELLVLYPQLIPADQKVTVLVLLQNNLELRPTGGFISSVGLATIDHGKLLSFDTKNIYDLDSNLRGIVTPPDKIKEYLAESSWYFRDANWDPDFLSSAVTANWFLGKEADQTADVVMAINLNSFMPFLQSINSINLSDGTNINATNLLISALNHQDDPNANTDLMSQLTKLFVTQVGQSPQAQAANLLESFHQSLMSGETTLVSESDQVNTILSEMRLSGTIYAPLCDNRLTTPCFADSLYLNEANVGVNKANYYVTRQISHWVDLGADIIKHTHTIILANQSPDNTWPAGTYKTYLRAYLPPNSQVLSLSINNKTVPAADIDVSSTSTYQLIGWYVEVDPQESSTITLTYQRQNTEKLKSYQFFLQKQPGILSSNVALQVTSSNPSYQIAPDDQQINQSFDSHLLHTIKFLP